MSSDYVRYSVVIPCFNDGAFVPGAIASVREHDAVEIVVVDDGSTDPATLTVLDDLRGRGIRVIRQDNAGLAAARMRGVAETSAPFVLCLDSDDELAPGALGELADAIEANPDAAFALGSLELFGARSEVRTFPPWDPWRLLYVNHWTATGLYRREELTAVGGWTLADCYEDWDLLLALAEHGSSPVIVDRVAIRYRQHDTCAHEYALSRAARRGLRDPAEPSPGALRPPARAGAPFVGTCLAADPVSPGPGLPAALSAGDQSTGRPGSPRPNVPLRTPSDHPARAREILTPGHDRARLRVVAAAVEEMHRQHTAEAVGDARRDGRPRRTVGADQDDVERDHRPGGRHLDDGGEARSSGRAQRNRVDREQREPERARQEREERHPRLRELGAEQHRQQDQRRRGRGRASRG